MMRIIDVDVPMTKPDFEMARHFAIEVAQANQMQEPMVVSWHSQRDNTMSPHFEGGRDTWWEKYGIGNYGEMQVSISNAYDFVLTDSRGYETLDEMPLREAQDSEGNTYTCYTSMLGDSNTPNSTACFSHDDWLAKQT